MEQILVYADSLSWGIIPGSRERLSFDKRWPGIFEITLNRMGDKNVRVLENCLNGRRTVLNDPAKEGRNGSQGLAQAIEMHSPLKLVILMLGSNDFQSSDSTEHSVAQGIARLIQIIREAPIEPGMPQPKIMLVAPPPIVKPKGAMAEKFKAIGDQIIDLSDGLKVISKSHSTYYFSAASVIDASAVDGIHLDEQQHKILGEAIACEVSSRIIF